MKIGEYNNLTIARFTDFGAYLTDDKGNEVLLPSKYIPRDAEAGMTMNLFVHVDSKGRPVATDEHPFATVGEVAFLNAVAVNDIGAFLDWGLDKNVLVPFREQKVKMQKGRNYLVYIYLDDASQRIAASAKIEKFIDNCYPDFKPFEKVRAIIAGRNDLGYKAVVNNRHSGIIYDNEIYRRFTIGDVVEAYVKKIRDDGKIDLTLLPPAVERTAEIGERIVERLQRSGGEDRIGDFLSPEYIAHSFGCSKKDFKKAVGHLLKIQKIEKTATGLRLLSPKE